MKKLLVLCSLALLVVPAVAGVDFAVGAKVMAGHADGFGPDYDDLLDSLDASRRFGFGIGLGGFAEVGITPVVAIQPEVMLTGLNPGYKYDLTVGPDTGEVLANAVTSTIDVAVLVKGKFDLGPRVLVALAGPVLQFAFDDWYIKQDIDNENIKAFLEGTGQDKIDIDRESFGYGIMAGLGSEWDIWKGVLMVEVRYFHGLTDWQKDTDASYRAFFLSVGYGFRLN